MVRVVSERKGRKGKARSRMVQRNGSSVWYSSLLLQRLSKRYAEERLARERFPSGCPRMSVGEPLKL